MSLPSIEEVVALQASLGVSEMHLVYLCEDGFTMAHTDREREDIDLEDCPTHLWLAEHGRGSAPVGYYWVHWHHDDHSESYPYFIPVGP